jgi:hypothetical protein
VKIIAMPLECVKIAVTPKEILQRVQMEADVRLGETVERLFSILRNRHTHQCWRKECGCEYCRFITGKYVDEKLALHALKKRIRILDDYWNVCDYELPLIRKLEMDASNQKSKIRLLKGHKKELQENIL